MAELRRLCRLLHDDRIIWINHHTSFSRLREVDHSILVWNLVLLLFVGALPFTTSLMATYLKEGQGESLAASRSKVGGTLS